MAAVINMLLLLSGMWQILFMKIVIPRTICWLTQKKNCAFFLQIMSACQLHTQMIGCHFHTMAVSHKVVSYFHYYYLSHVFFCLFQKTLLTFVPKQYTVSKQNIPFVSNNLPILALFCLKLNKMSCFCSKNVNLLILFHVVWFFSWYVQHTRTGFFCLGCSNCPHDLCQTVGL